MLASPIVLRLTPTLNSDYRPLCVPNARELRRPLVAEGLA
jgi:hypothetical protein